MTTVVCGNCGVSASPHLRSDIGHFLSLIVKKQRLALEEKSESKRQRTLAREATEMVHGADQVARAVVVRVSGETLVVSGAAWS